MMRSLFFHYKAGLCGLTHAEDIRAALKKVSVHDFEGYRKHISTMTDFYNSYGQDDIMRAIL